MAWEPIVKRPSAEAVAPNMPDYERARGEFSWEVARRQLDGLPEGRGLNISHEAVDRHVAGSRRGHVALRFVGKDGTRRELTYGQLRYQTGRFANVLRRIGVMSEDRVFTLLSRVPELYVAALGTLKHRAVTEGVRSQHGGTYDRAETALRAKISRFKCGQPCRDIPHKMRELWALRPPGMSSNPAGTPRALWSPDAGSRRKTGTRGAEPRQGTK
jgi:hypothetical protein